MPVWLMAFVSKETIEKIKPYAIGFLKVLFVILALAAVVAALYFWGRSNGHAAGFTDAWDKQQKVINGMVDAENARRNQANEKIAQLETDSRNAAASLAAMRKELDEREPQIITEYETKYVEVAKQCGFSEPTVSAFNQLLGVN